jgi:tRNA-dihydrouridine synthase
MFKETGVDAVMIGRGVLSNPWLMRQCRDYLSGNAVQKATLRERGDFMLSFLRRASECMPAPAAIGKMKRMGGYLSKGIPGGAHLRADIHAARSCEEILSVTRDFLFANHEIHETHET